MNAVRKDMMEIAGFCSDSKCKPAWKVWRECDCGNPFGGNLKEFVIAGLTNDRLTYGLLNHACAKAYKAQGYLEGICSIYHAWNHIYTTITP